MNKNILSLIDPDLGTLLIQKGDSQLVNDNGESHPIVNEIPRFVGKENYANNFGAQWNEFPKTQLDSYTGIPISELRLERCMEGHLPKLKGKMLLEAGSGAGRFTEVLLKHGATVHSFDFSNAVEANQFNNGHHDSLTLVQADIRRIPFPKASYDFVVCLGVIQHTPNPEESIRCLWEMVKPGGYLVIDHYRWNLGLVLPPPIGGAESLYRWLILKLPMKSRFKVVKAITNFWFPVHWLFRDSKWIQRILVRLSPVHFYYPLYKLGSRKVFYEWALLDTHDGTTDFYKHYRNENQIYECLEKLGAEDIVVNVAGNGVEAFSRKPRGQVETIEIEP
jgi:SAM-dependent methyltransferase